MKTVAQRTSELGSLGVTVRTTFRFFQIVALSVSIEIFSGCATREFGAALGEKVFAQILLPPLELSLIAGDFHQTFDRWPTNYTELCAYSQSARGITLTNYSSVDFTPTADGGLEVLALAKGITNRMTWSLPEDSQK